MENDTAEPPASSAARIGWGMALLAVGIVFLASTLARSSEGDPPGFVVMAALVLLAGWGLLMAGLVTLAQRVDRLSQTSDGATTPTP